MPRQIDKIVKMCYNMVANGGENGFDGGLETIVASRCEDQRKKFHKK